MSDYAGEDTPFSRLCMYALLAWKAACAIFAGDRPEISVTRRNNGRADYAATLVTTAISPLRNMSYGVRKGKIRGCREGRRYLFFADSAGGPRIVCTCGGVLCITAKESTATMRRLPLGMIGLKIVEDVRDVPLQAIQRGKGL